MQHSTMVCPGFTIPPSRASANAAIVALAPLESLCAKATVPRPSTGSFNYTATASGTTAPKATHHPSGPSISPSPGLASNEYDLHPSLAALVAVIAAALAML